MDWRERLPEPAARRLAIRVGADAARQLRGGSPWLYDGSIVSGGEGGRPGDLAVAFDGHRRFVAVGLWDPASPIRLKVLHAGEPATIDAAWFGGRLRSAWARRELLAADPDTTGYRCVHGENDGLPGLVIDRYGSTYVIKLYSPAWFAHLGGIVDAAVELAAPERVVVRLARSIAAGPTFGLADGDVLVGSAPERPVRFVERGLAMQADVQRGQKTGHFLDQRDNRSLVRGLAEGADVLDVFASTGGFAVSAAAGGARSVHMIDQSPQALETARRNFALNRHIAAVARAQTSVTVGDAFEVLAELGRRAEQRFDVVVIDPPSFANAQAATDRAVRAYAALTRLGLGVLRPGGTLVQASCSSRVGAESFFDTVIESARRAGRPLRELRRTGHPVDHPVGFSQGAYLKAIFATA